MTKHIISLPDCISYGNNLKISEEIWNNLSCKTYDGGGQTTLVRHVVGVCERHEIFEDHMTCTLFIYTLRGHPLHWHATLPQKSIHSFHHLIAEIDCAFNHFDYKALNKEILKLRKAPDEFVEQFYMCFRNLAHRFPEDEIDWELLNGRFTIFFTSLKIYNP